MYFVSHNIPKEKTNYIAIVFNRKLCTTLILVIILFDKNV